MLSSRPEHTRDCPPPPRSPSPSLPFPLTPVDFLSSSASLPSFFCSRPERSQSAIGPRQALCPPSAVHTDVTHLGLASVPCPGAGALGGQGPGLWCSVGPGCDEGQWVGESPRPSHPACPTLPLPLPCGTPHCVPRLSWATGAAPSLLLPPDASPPPSLQPAARVDSPKRWDLLCSPS